MIDGVKCSCIGLNAKLWRSNSLLDFGLCVSENTGELLTQRREAEYQSLRFVLSPLRGCEFSCSIAGSLHKYKNKDNTNFNDFTFSELSDTLHNLEHTFNINLNQTSIHGLEIGVNIQLDYNPEIILKNVICHKGRTFDNLSRKSRKLGLVCSYENYEIKLYDKGEGNKIAELDKYVLRYELRIKKQRELEPYNIFTLADLTDNYKISSLVELLIKRLNEIVFFDFSYKGTELSECKRLQWERYSNPKYWGNLDRNNHYKARKKYMELLEKYGCVNWQKFVLKNTTNKWVELCQIKQEKGRHFHHILGGTESRKKATFSHLEYLGENVTAGDVFKVKENEHENNPICCINCGRQITGQKRGSFFCSERLYGKEAKRCRNKNSNRRLAIKRKIQRAMNKDLMLVVTYRYNGTEYSDTLGANEISVTRKWLDRVTSVVVLKPQPSTLTDKEAKDYLQTISNTNNNETTY